MSLNMLKGCVYVITTQDYEKSNIYKIGCTSNLSKRLKTLNATRIDNDKFKIKTTIHTMTYYELELGIHKILYKYRLNNEFFRCPYFKIINAIREFSKSHPSSFIFFDVILYTAHKNKLTFESGIWSCLDDNIHCNFNDDNMILQIKKWLINYDKYTVFTKFAHYSFWEDILQTLKDYFNVQDSEYINFDISENDVDYLCRKFNCSIDINLQTNA